MSTAGFIFNKKGFVVSRNATTDTAYVLTFVDNGVNGTQVVVEQWSKAATGSRYVKNGNIYPVVPYRIITCSNDVLNASCVNDGDAPTTIPLFNPGLTYSDGINGLPESYSDQKFVEVNLTRKQLNKLNSSTVARSFFQYFKETSGRIRYASFSVIAASDVNAGLCVYEKDSNTDYLILSVVTQINYSLAVFSNNSETKPKFNYTVPFVLVFEVSKSISGDSSVIPISWTYGLAPSRTANSRLHELTKINSLESGTFYTKHWNYNVIAGKYIAYPSTSTVTYWGAQDIGSLVDTAIDGTNAIITSSVTYRGPDSRWYSQVIVFSIADIFTKTGFMPDTLIQNFRKSEKSYLPTKIASAYSNGYYASCVTLSYGSINAQGQTSILSESHIMITTIGSASNLIIVKGCKDIDVDAFSSSFAFSLVDYTGNQKILDAGTVSTLQSRLLPEPRSIEIRDLTASRGFSEILNRPLSSTSSINIVGGIEQRELFNIPTAEYVYNSIENPILNNSLLRNSTQLVYLTNLNDVALMTVLYKNNSHTIVSSTAGSLLDSLERRILNSNIASTSYGILEYNEDDVVKIQDNLNSNIVIGDSASFAYTSTYGVNTEDGIDTLLEIPCCTGVYAKGGWDTVQGGVEIDSTKTRIDFQFALNGTKSEFDTYGLGGYGYWADLVYPRPSVKLYIPGRDEPISEFKGMSFARYNTNGSGIIQVGLKLLLDGVKDATLKEYQDEGYDLTNITAKIRIPAVDVITKTITGISFTPPSAGISLSVSDTKSPDRNFIYSVTKTNSHSKSRSCIFTQVKNGVSNPFNDLTLIDKLNNNNTLSTNVSIDLNGCVKGDYLKAEWEEELNGRTFYKNASVVSYVEGHRYLIESPVTIYIDGSDKTSDIFNKDYVFLAPGAGSVEVKVSGINITHEDFSDHDVAGDNVPTDYRRYPIISTVYLYVVPSQTWPKYRVWTYKGVLQKLAIYEEIPPVDAPVTYPNGGDAFAEYLSGLGGSSTSTSYGGTTVSLSNIYMSTNVSATGRYQIFLVVKDEYDQYSVFNITSTLKSGNNKTYRTKFGARI